MLKQVSHNDSLRSRDSLVICQKKSRLVRPRTVNGTVPPRRRKNAELRTREYLTESEIDRLIKAVRANRYGLRDATMILMAFRHVLRAAELVDLRWEQVELGHNAVLHVRRVKPLRATKCGRCAN
jgi:type 1 fimbriae regulatory protein FimB/type 1 fimbriae regulatory protein FimE